MDKPEKRKATTDCNGDDSDTAVDKRRKVIGPALPPPRAVEDEEGSDNDDDDESDDDFGPSLPPPEGTVPMAASNAAPISQSQEDSSTTTKAQRDAWMLLPPSELDRGSRVDPTKLRNRKFQTGRAAGGSSAGGGVDAAWTETPEEKMKRLQNEAMGISSRGPSSGDDSGSREAKSSEAMRERIKKYNEQKKREGSAQVGPQRPDKEEEDDPSSRAFDREKDMALSSKLTHAQRRELINKSSDFGSRFTKGKFL